MKIIELSTTEVRPLNRRKIDGRFNPTTSSTILVLSEEDLLNENLLCTIKGVRVDIVLIPESIKELFLEDRHIRPAILSAMPLTGSVEYF